jgi:2-polyprenyl-6-methoxyphenol hydroxylase-like FAD-dependent oxidoreductase
LTLGEPGRTCHGMGQADSAEIVIVGGGPAGMLAGLLFARAGIDTLVLEKHADFFRDFRGDTVHSSTMEILSELGMLDRFLQRPHHRLDKAEIDFNGRLLTIGDLSHLKTPAPFIAMMPQWDFLDFLRDEAAVFPTFRLRMQAEAAALVEVGGRMAAVRLSENETIQARKLVIVADGRDSLIRRDRLLPLEDLGAPIDVLWFAVPKAERGDALRGSVRGRHLLVQIDRGDYWQCAYVIAKGEAQAIINRGIERFRAEIGETAPMLSGLKEALPDFDKVRLLSVSLDRLTRWHRPGLLAIGDAAHAMSPVGGVGINLAIQDAVCAANVLAGSLAQGRPVDDLLERVERRRLLPTRIIQAGQRAAHDFLLSPLLSGRTSEAAPPLPLRLLDAIPMLRRLPGRLIGLGIRREHVRSPAAELQSR